MILLINLDLSAAIYLTRTDEYGDRRRYYEFKSALIVCRNGGIRAG